MLELVYCPDWKRLSAEVYAGMTDNRTPGRRVLIVPEQYSFEAERQLCLSGGPTVSRYAEVLSFSRLAERAAARCGGVARPVMDGGGRLMALARSLEQVRTRLKFYAGSARRADFLPQLLSMVDELKCCRVDSARLTEAAARVEGSLAVKTQELALLLEGYDAVCSRGLQDPRDRLALLCEHITQRGFGRELRLYVDGFFGFTAVELQILGAFLAQGASVTVALCCDGLFDGELLFERVRETARLLMQQADRCGAKVAQRALQVENAPFVSIARSAFTRTAAEHSDGLRLYECATPRQEAQSICADILSYIQAGGRYRDIAIACGDNAALRPILEAELERCAIPVFYAEKRPALRTPLLSAMLSALRAAAGTMGREEVVTYLKSDGAPLTQEESDRLENYTLLWDISGERWLKAWTLHPRGFGHAMEDADRETLAALNALRERCLTPLGTLRRAFRTERTVGGYVQAVYAFLQETGFSRCVSHRLAELEQQGASQALQITRQLYELLLQALEQLYAVQYDAQCDPEEFVRLMELLLSQYQVGAIPAVLDAVTIGAPAALQHSSMKELYFCGCVDGLFHFTGGSLLNEPERRRLREVGVQLAPDEAEQLDRQLVGLYALLCAPSTRLCLSVGGGVPASFFSVLTRLYPDACAPGSDAPPPVYATARTLGLWLAQQGTWPGAPDAAKEYCALLKTAATYTFGSLAPADVHGLYGAAIRLSASRIDRYAACRFSFFLHDGLKAQERRTAEFDAPVYGSFVHYVLERTLRQANAEGGAAAMDAPRLQAIARGHMEAYLRTQLDPELLASPRFSYLLRRNFAEVEQVVGVLHTELSHSEFRPADFELTFASGGALPPVTLHTPNAAARISGAVDRVDLMTQNNTTYFRVIDYKTGKKDFDYTDILERRGLQMLIYLFALEKNGIQYYGKPIHPAGMLYVSARDELLFLPQRPDAGTDAAAERLKSHRRKGLLLNDPMLLEAMEPTAGQSPKLLPYRMLKSGPVGDLMGIEQLRLLRRYVADAVASLADEIQGGSVRPNPYVRGATGACTYCPYGSVCHLDLCTGEVRSLKATSAAEFWTRLAQKEENNG